MDHHKKKNNTILNPFTQIYSSKKAIKILLTLSLFCILFSYSSLFSSLFSTFSIKLFSYYYYSTDRNYIFLLCNGILILIIKNSGFLSIAPSNTDHFRDNYAKKNVQSHQSTGFREYNVKKNTQLNRYSSFSDVSSSQTDAEEITKAVVEVDKAEGAIITFTDEVGEDVSSIAHNEEKEKEVDEILNIVKEEEEFVNMEEEEEEGIELLSREELNKKCEEFIRKMKHGIKFGSTLPYDGLVSNA